LAEGREEKTPMISWDERYATDDYFYGTQPNDFLRAWCPEIRRGGDVLCLAEGEGRNAVFLAGQGFHPLAVDQSPVGLGKAAKLASAQGVHIDTVVADLAAYRIEAGRWDGIVSIWCHLPGALRAAVHRQVVAGLRAGGVFLLEAYTPAQLAYGTGGPKDADLLPTLAGLRKELAGLEFVHAEERERVIHEGAGHDGLSAVVQVVARAAT
jgi:hypothetical protein